MLTLILGYILIGLIPLLFYFRKYKVLFIIALLSQYTECVGIVINGFKLTADVYIGAICFFLNFNLLLKANPRISRYLWIEYFWVIGIGFFFLFFPWHDSAMLYRTWTQSQTGRTLMGIVRMIEPILVFYFFFYVFFYQKISLHFFLKTISIISVGSFLIGFIDTFLLEGNIKAQFHFLNRDVLTDRFTGLFVEPRYFARSLGMTMLVLLCLKNTITERKTQSLFTLTIGCCLAGMIFSFSTSAIGATIFAFVVYLFIFKVSLKKVLIYASVIAILLTLVLQNDEFIEHNSRRLAVVLVEDSEREIPNIPTFISGFEANDAVALAFFYTNPQHLIWGVGPNTICIPANDFMSSYAQKQFEFSLNNPPYTFLLSFFSRSGLIGIICYGLVFSVLSASLIKNHRQYSGLIWVCFAFFFISSNNFNIIFGVLGMVSALDEQIRRNQYESNPKQWT